MNVSGAPSDIRENFYELLEVSPRASADVIRAAFHVLARTYHPDVNPSAASARHMRKLNVAYSVLSDPLKRAEYDAATAPAARASRWKRAEQRAQSAPSRPSDPAPRGHSSSRRVRADVHGEVSARRGILTPLGRIVLASMAMMIVVGFFFALWVALDALEDTAAHRSSYSMESVPYSAPPAAWDASFGPNLR